MRSEAESRTIGREHRAQGAGRRAQGMGPAFAEASADKAWGQPSLKLRLTRHGAWKLCYAITPLRHFVFYALYVSYVSYVLFLRHYAITSLRHYATFNQQPVTPYHKPINHQLI
ncbi:MAG: hypothetical protein FJY11_02185 [Bacteroidetes bacterium]|nr:hypothetical protein [Bacteroidota bacterium]